MAIYILETGRGFPNVDAGGEYQQNWERPSSSRYKSHKFHSGPGTNYNITFNDDGPGSSIFGQDKVYYIGNQEEICVGNCDNERVGIHRFYRSDGGNQDHKFTANSELRYPEDFPGATRGNRRNLTASYNKEPRNGQAVFYMSGTNVTGSTQLYHWYNATLKDSALSTSSSYLSGYVNVGTVGYIYTSASNASTYADTGETAVPLYEYYKNRNNSSRDHFYTADPTREVNLQTNVAGVPNPGDPRDQEYTYVGIVGYVFLEDLGQGNRKTLRDQGIIGPTGYGSPVSYGTRAGWYNWDATGAGIYTQKNYEYQYDANAGPLNPTPTQRRNNRWRGTPSTSAFPNFGWGDPTLCPNLNTDALFEWVYGKSGAVKAAVPRYLEFHTLFDSQFTYYVYDTSYPWKGPVFGIQYATSNRNCCPNQKSGGNCLCNESLLTYDYYSHFYEIREDSWKTTRSKMAITGAPGGTGVNESFKTVDTDTKRILFRYTTRFGDSFSVGDTVNGWEISEVAYFGNKLRAGYMELKGEGKKFTYNQTITANGENGKEAQVICGYGIADKAGFFGVYEFPKRVSYYRVEIDKTALVSKQSIDIADVECIVNKNGEIQSIQIINGGRWYINPKIVIEEPAQLTEGGSMDNVKENMRQLDGWEGAPLRSPTSTLDNPDGTKHNFTFNSIKENQRDSERSIESDMNEREAKVPYGKDSNTQIVGADDEPDVDEQSVSMNDRSKVRTISAEHRRKGKFRQAKVEILSLTADGAIDEIVIRDRGFGYDTDPNRKPKVWIIQTEDEQYKMRGPNTKQQQKGFKGTVDANEKTEDLTERMRGTGVEPSQGSQEVTGIKGEVRTKSGAKENQLSIMDDGVMGSFESMMEGFTAEYPTGYIKMTSPDDVEKTKLCNNLPAGCVNIEMPSVVGKALFPVETVQGIIEVNSSFKSVMENQYPEMKRGATTSDESTTSLSDLYGWNSGDECISIAQPKFKTVTRLQDLPCPYVDEDTGKNFGWMIYKYCAAEGDNASFKVSLSVEAKTIGPQGEAFMEFMQKLARPQVQPTRPVIDSGNKKKMWRCTRQNIEGRCYWAPSGADDVVFVPVGLDENTFSWDAAGFSEVQQLELWLGNNFVHSTKSVSNSGDPFSQTFNVISVSALSGGVPPNECWDTYLRHGNNANGVLDVYSAYYNNNNTQGKTAGGGYWTSSGLYNGYTCGSSPCTGTLSASYGTSGFNNNNACGLEYVNDISVAVDPRMFTQLGMRMGPYTGTMNVKNWNTGSNIAFGQAVQNMGNPFFAECEGEAFGQSPAQINPQPPLRRRRVHKSSYDPGDAELLKSQARDINDLEFEDDSWRENYDPDFDYEAEIANNPVSDFSTNPITDMTQ